jgi:hypothetical protein
MKLFILGNGFDIAHQIPCKYSQFCEYLNENHPEILQVMEKFYYVESDSDLWSDFETSLEKDIDYDSLREIIGENVPNFASDDFRDGDWYTAETYVKDECKVLLENIRSGFHAWINSLAINTVQTNYNLNPEDFYITFNYTEVLERVYHVPDSQILHIHNKVGEELIFGHGKDSADFDVQKALYGRENAFVYEDEDGITNSDEIGHEKFAENAVSAFYDKMRKPTENVLKNTASFFDRLAAIDEIIVLGHSYNEIDFPYFQKIAQSVSPRTKWLLYYFSEQDLSSAENIMSKVEVRNDLVEFKHSTELESNY